MALVPSECEPAGVAKFIVPVFPQGAAEVQDVALKLPVVGSYQRAVTEPENLDMLMVSVVETGV